jgi:hypothetical protein
MYQKKDREENNTGGGSTEDKYISALLSKTILNLFVGQLNIDSTCFVWDQCLMLGKCLYFSMLCLFDTVLNSKKKKKIASFFYFLFLIFFFGNLPTTI